MSGGEHLPKLSMAVSSVTAAFSATSNSANSSIGASKSLQQQLSLSSMSQSHIANQRYVKLNVGGRLFSTSLDTLTKQDNMLRAMFSGRLDVSTDADGYILIDRCGRHFEFLLNYLRDDDPMYVQIALQDKCELELFEILKEAKFYCMQPLVAMIEQKIMLSKAQSASEPYFGPSVVSMITSKNDLNKILNSTDKPCIRLLINRHNNKYSYTNTSDDNLLKNIELFERMSIKFKNRIMFIKDTTSNEEICCWYFHGSGKKLAEVCCTSIVYTTEKKQTKVEFPDSKILEEIFVNAVLFESKETQNNNNLDAVSNQIRYENGCEDDEDMPRISLYQSSGGASCAVATSSSSASSAAVGSSAAAQTPVGNPVSSAQIASAMANLSAAERTSVSSASLARGGSAGDSGVGSNIGASPSSSTGANAANTE